MALAFYPNYYYKLFIYIRFFFSNLKIEILHKTKFLPGCVVAGVEVIGTALVGGGGGNVELSEQTTLFG